MNYLNRHSPNTLARLDEYGRFDIGGPIGLGDIQNQFTQDPTIQAAGNMALDVAPGTGEYRSVTQHLPQAYQNYQNAQTPIQKTLRAAEMGLEGGSTVAGMVPGMKAAATGFGSLLMMMAKKNHDLVGIARSPQAARQLGIIGYHGSPHNIQPNAEGIVKFDHSKMGTGEGAQAYGWGTYLADTPDVAKGYSPRDLDFEDRLMSMYKQAEARQDYTSMEVLENAMMHETPTEIRARYAGPDYDDDFRGAVSSVIDEIEPLYQQSNSNLYEVDLPDDQIEKMLDWDAPLSEQPESVRRGFEQYWEEMRGVVDESIEVVPVSETARVGDNYFEWRMPSDVRENATFRASGFAKTKEDAVKQATDFITARGKLGQDIYARMVTNAGSGLSGPRPRISNASDLQRAASEKLNQYGIPGIKYFDGNSRSAGEGTRNFVVFDENDMSILTRNGEPVAQSADSLPMDEASRIVD